MADESIDKLKERFDLIVDKFNQEIKNIRTGRATPSVLDGVMVDYYGVATPINQMAAVNATDAKTITITPWDKDQLISIEKAIKDSDLNFNPGNDGEVIRIILPPMTEERRLELVKVLKAKTEESRIKIRQFREDVLNDIQEQEKLGNISEDDRFRAKDQVQKIVDEYNKKIEEIEKKKEADVMAV
jgi:ribosome recycling factor